MNSFLFSRQHQIAPNWFTTISSFETMFTNAILIAKRILCRMSLTTQTKWDIKKHDLEGALPIIDPVMRITKNENKSQNRWTFWGLYIRDGLMGSILNLLWLNPIALVLMLVEMMANCMSTYAMTVLTTKLTTLINTSNHPLQSTDSIPSINLLILMIGVVLFAGNLTTLIKRLLRGASTYYKNQIIIRIKTVVVDHMSKSSPETDSEFSLGDKVDALDRFVWVYDNVTNTLVELTVHAVRSLTFCLYVIYIDIRMLPIYIVVYYSVWRFVISQTSQKNPNNGEAFMVRFYNDIATSEMLKVNPQFRSLYTEASVPSVIKANLNVMPDPDELTKEDAERSIGRKVVHPDVVARFMETIHYYSIRNMNWMDSHEKLVVVRNTVNMIIIIFMLYTSQYSLALIILINRSSMFGLFDMYSNMMRIEKSANKSMENIIKILETIDKQTEKGETPVEQFVKQDMSNIVSITIDDLAIVIPAQQKRNKESLDEDEKEEKIVNYNRSIVLSHVDIDVRHHKCLLLDGHTGCGKSVTINALAGRYSKKVCRSMRVGYSDGSVANVEFNEILGSRCYVSQMLSDDYKYNGKIAMPIFALFPGASDIAEITEFLTSVFMIKRSSIPTLLTDTPHSKLSGGEIQRYVVASQVWKALRIRTDIMILDEVDRALDKETAVHVISWIIDNIDSFFVVVSHLTEVKEMLYAKKCVTQVWTYDDTTNKQEIRILPNRV